MGTEIFTALLFITCYAAVRHYIVWATENVVN